MNTAGSLLLSAGMIKEYVLRGGGGGGGAMGIFL